MNPDDRDTTTNQGNDTPPTPQPDNFSSLPPKPLTMKKSIKPLVVGLLLVLLLLVLGATYAYFSMPMKQQKSVTASDSKVVPAKPKMFENQLSLQILRYDLDYETVNVLTDQVPNNTQLLVLYDDNKA